MSFHARDVANMSEADRAAFLASLTPTEAEDLQYDWEHWARPELRLPDGDWINWLILAGRGYGKTRVGAETVRQWVKRYRHVNLIGATADDVRTIARRWPSPSFTLTLWSVWQLQSMWRERKRQGRDLRPLALPSPPLSQWVLLQSETKPQGGAPERG